MKKSMVLAKHLVLEDTVLRDFALIYSDKIEDIIPATEANSAVIEQKQEADYVLPGFIDVHIHGSQGADVMDGTSEALETISRAICASGTTSFLPTTMTMSTEMICQALTNIRRRMQYQEENQKTIGARVLGAHLEGPFISAVYKGAQDPTHIQKPNNQWLKDYYDVVKLITMAPEEDDHFAMVKEWSSQGIVVSIGHTNADYETAVGAYEAGARHMTHLFNAMTPLHHRKPGVVGAGLLHPFNVEMITDGFHLHPDMIKLVTRCKPNDQLILVTDCMRAGFMGDGESELGGQKVTVQGDKCLLESGTIAGSILRLDKALRNVLKFTDKELCEVVRMLTINPARDLGLQAQYGSLEEGKMADLVFMDEALEVQQTIVAGISQFKAS